MMDRQLRTAFAVIRSEVAKKWPKDLGAHMRSVSNLLFLRLICPAILGPKLFGIATGMLLITVALC